MNIYSIALFLHIVGALGFFVALGLEWISLLQMRRAATAEQVKAWALMPARLRPVAMLSVLLLFAAGFYMMVSAWGGKAWILVALGAFILLMVLGARLSRGRIADILQAVNSENGTVSPSLHQLIRHPLLWISIQTRVTVSLGIVFLMTAKPDLIGSLLAITIAAILGLASAFFHLSHERTGEVPAL